MMSLSLTVKLASLVVHVQEGIDTGHPFDAAAVSQIARDPEVVAWLSTLDPALLPVKR